jgi:hypothetical protein
VRALLVEEKSGQILKNFWPVNREAELPIDIFPDPYLEEIFLHLGPRMWGCGQSSVRKTLKSIVKKQMGLSSTQPWNKLEGPEKDRALVSYVCNNNRTRDALQNAELARKSGDRRAYRGMKCFAECVWHVGFIQNPDPKIKSFSDWVLSYAKPRKNTEPGAMFLTAAILTEALQTSEPIFEVSSIEFARTILLFASLLESDECADLIKTALKAGCDPLRLAFHPSEASDRPGESTPPKSSNAHAQLPRMAQVTAESLSFEPAIPEPKSSALAEKISVARLKKDEAKLPHAIATATGNAIASLKPDEFSTAIQHVTNLQIATTNLEQILFERDEYINISTETLSKVLNCKILHTNPFEDFQVTIAGEALSTINAYSLKTDRVSQWIDSFGGSIPLERVTELNRVYAQDEFATIARSNFLDAVTLNIPDAELSDISQWLDDLNVEEYRALFEHFESSNQPVLSSLLLSTGLERFADEFDDSAIQRIKLVNDRTPRRDLLRFVDAMSSHLDVNPTLMRFVIAERLYDIFDGPSLTELSDLGTVALEHGVVGSNVATLIQTIVSGLSVTDNPSRLRELIAAADRIPINTATVLAIEFIQAPAGLSGNYKRLREKARELVFLPLVQGDYLNTRLASAALRRLEDGSYQQEIWRAVEDSITNGVKLENQHRAQLTRYLENGRRLIEAALRAGEETSKAHEMKFADELCKLLDQMPSNGEPGTEDWLQAEIRSILSQPTKPNREAAFPNARRNQNSADWMDLDDVWARKHHCDAPFYDGSLTSRKEALCLLLRHHSHSYEDRVELAFRTLLEQRNYKSANVLLVENNKPLQLSTQLRHELDRTFESVLEAYGASIQGIKDEFGTEAVDATNSIEKLSASLAKYDEIEARDNLALLELELMDAKQQAEHDAELAKQAIESSHLLASLLRAGITDIPIDMALPDLRKKWKSVLDFHSGNRQHLIEAFSVVGILSPDIPEFSILDEPISRLKTQLEDPEQWLDEEISENLTSFLAGSTRKLRSWAEAAPILDQGTKRVLARLIHTFLDFIQEQAELAREAQDAEEVDSILEQAMEVETAITDGVDPAGCLAAVAKVLDFEAKELLDHTGPAVLRGPQIARRNNDDFAVAVASAVAAKAWTELRALARNERNVSSDEEITRVDEVVDFSETLLSFDVDDGVTAYDYLDGATRAIVSAGHPVYRALPARERLTLVLKLLVAALLREAPKTEAQLGPFAASNVTTFWPNLFKLVGEVDRHPQTARILEYAFSSNLAFEASEALWTASQPNNDAAAFRSDLLRHLHDLRQYEVISRLCARYDRSAQLKVEQMLGLRAAASTRPDLLPAAEALAHQASTSAKSAAFRSFIRGLPTAAQTVEGKLSAVVQEKVLIRKSSRSADNEIQISVSITAQGVVPTKLQAHLFQDDDVRFGSNNGRLLTLSDELLYVAKEFVLDIKLGESWTERLSSDALPSVRIRFAAKTITDTVVTTDIVCPLKGEAARPAGERRIDRDTLLEYYPGVGNTPAEGANFIGRHLDLEQLTSFLVVARHPSPILLTGMRRVGKTSLLYAFHNRHAKPGDGQALTVYLSIAEKRNSFVLNDQTVSTAFFRAVARSLGKPFFPHADPNKALGDRLKKIVGTERDAVRKAIDECHDPESFADSIMHLTERVLEWLDEPESRLIFLIDEAESLVVPYNHGGTKRLELEQLLLSLREISQTSNKVGIVLSGSNHINTFAREYKNAFFGSCVRMELAGITDPSEASLLIAPKPVSAFVEFDHDAIDHGVSLCAGMPQFMWQLGAATTWSIRGGEAHRSDVRSAMNALISGGRDGLPFQPYEVLEPIEHMLKLQGNREQDLLWLLLRRVAINSSLAVADAPRHFLLDQSLLDLDGRDVWNKRLSSLIELNILRPTGNSSVSFAVPLFAEAFRSSRMEHEYAIRLQRVSA